MRRPILAGGGALLCVGLAFALFMTIPVATQEPGPRFSDWGPAAPLGAPFTTTGRQQGCPFISKDDLDLYFRAQVQPPGSTAWTWDIFVSHRDSVDAPWGTPVNLGPNVNKPTSNEFCSFVTIDGHWLYFVSNRTDARGGAYGGQDILLSHRKDRDDPTGWEPPVNLGPCVNSSSADNGPSIFEDEATGKLILYFTSAKSGTSKIYQTELLDWDNPGPATEVTELNSAGTYNMHAFVRRRDGLEVIFGSDRGNADQWTDLWTSTRRSTSSSWSTPVRLGTQVDPVDPMADEARPSISWDGTTLYFWSDRPGTPPYYLHIYMATRTKITGKNK
jgi:hypothetical protein